MSVTQAAEQLTNRFKRQASYQARLMRAFEKQYLHCEVIEQLPNGAFAVADIVAMSWEKTLWNPVEECNGDWCFRIRYVADGYESETSPHALTLTGRKFEVAS